MKSKVNVKTVTYGITVRIIQGNILIKLNNELLITTALPTTVNGSI